MITVLIGGSILLIVGSGIALVFGFSGTDDTLLWTSIGASAGAALFLALAYFESKRQTRAGGTLETTRADETSSPRELDAEDESAPPVVERPDEPVETERAEAEAEPEPEPEQHDPVPEEVGAASSATAELPVPDVGKPAKKPRARTTRKTPSRPSAKKTTRKTTAKPAKAESSSSAKPASATPKRPANQVVAIPTTKKFHKADCRYASAAGGERLTKTTARRRGYSACGVCKP